MIYTVEMQNSQGAELTRIHHKAYRMIGLGQIMTITSV
jgi:hypothetical protein